MTSATGRSERAKRRNELRGDTDFDIPENPKRKRVQIQVPVENQEEIMEVLTPEELETRAKLISNVFSNELLWKHITMELSVFDMKKLSTVNHVFFDKIKESKHFQNTSLVPIALTKLTPELHPNHNLQLVWKNVELNITNLTNTNTSYKLKKLIPTLQRRFRDTKSLYIYSKYYRYDSSQTCQTCAEVPIFKTILSSAPNLDSLTLVSTMMKMDWTKVLKDAKVRACFEQLNELHLILGDNVDNFEYGPKWGEVSFILNNFKQLAKIPLKLRSFTWGRWTLEVAGSMELNYSVNMDLSPIIDILRSSQGTLNTLSLRGRIIKTDGFEEIRCPALRNLKIYSTNLFYVDRNYHVRRLPELESLRKFYSFLENLENLEDLDISMLEEGVINDVLPILKTKSKQWRLKRLRISLKMESNTLNGIYWDSIHFFELDSRMYYRHVLPELPSHLRSLNLRNLLCNHNDTTPALSTFIRMELERFSCLTELSLLNHEREYGEKEEITPVDDDLLQFIFSHFMKLKIFRLSNCPSITNYGFAGSRDDTVSILNLKSLRHLVILNCPNVNDQFGLIGGLKFPELTFLLFDRKQDIFSTGKIPDIPEVTLCAWKDIARNNPKLNTIVLYNSKNLRIARELKAVNSSIRRVYNTYFNIRAANPPFSVSAFDTPSTMFYEDMQYTDCCGFEGDRYASDDED